MLLLPANLRANAGPKPHDCPVQTDPDVLNSFSKAYNRYIASLNRGIVNIALWKDAAAHAKRAFAGCVFDE